ncbi:hypothetical protein [Caproicibacterium sp. XB2]
MKTMTDEEMLAAIQQMLDQQFGQVNTRLDNMDTRLDSMDAKISDMQTDIADIKQDAAITRSAANTLLDWAEKAQVEVKIPLYRKEAE